MTFRLKLLGGAALFADEGPLSGRATQKRRIALLALLATGGEAGVSRDRLMAILWPESDSERGRHLLSDSAYRINQALGGEAIVAIGDALALNATRVSSDLAEFRAASDRGAWQAAVSLYGGPLLDGFHISDSAEFERWTDMERDRLANRYARAVEQLANERSRSGDAMGAVDAWRRLTTHDPLSARVALEYMKALDAAGDRAAAIRHARIHAALLEQELGAEPDPAVESHAAQLCAGPPTTAPAPRSESNAARDAAPDETPREPAAEVVGDSVTAGAAIRPGDRSDGQSRSSTDPPFGTDGGRKSRQSVLHRAAAAVRRQKAIAATSVIVLLASLALAVWAFERVGASNVPSTIAVLPFADLTPQAGQAYLSDGITEELITALSEVPGLRVAARTSSFAFKGKPADVREVGKQLGVEAVLEGSVRTSGDALRITAQLVSVRDGYPLWSETYERRMSDAFAIQDEIAGQIVRRLGRSRPPAGPPTGDGAAPQAVDPAAYDLFLKGRYAWHQRTEPGLLAAAEHLEEAVRRAPRYARAHAGLGEAYAVLGFYDYMDPSVAFPRAARAARRSLALDSGLASPHAILAYVALYYDWDFATAEGEFQRAIALDSSYSIAHQWYGNLLTAMGRFDEAERAMRRAMELDPLSLIANAALGWVHYYAGDYPRAIAQLDRTLDLNPDFELARMWKGQVYTALGRHDSAVVVLEDASRRAGRTALSLAVLAYARAASGDAAGARRLLEEVERRADDAYVPAFEIARVHVALGEPDRAIAWLERAATERAHSIAFLTVDPALVPLRGRPRFEKLVSLRTQ
jgi:TolB-like protein/DNA-binding SARP family transcriptional activator